VLQGWSWQCDCQAPRKQKRGGDTGCAIHRVSGLVQRDIKVVPAHYQSSDDFGKNLINSLIFNRFSPNFASKFASENPTNPALLQGLWTA
jgi:hypothetical protein